MNHSSDLKNFANSWPSESNFKTFSRSHFFLIVGQNNFGNKIPVFPLFKVGKRRKKAVKELQTVDVLITYFTESRILLTCFLIFCDEYLMISSKKG